jgi:hypothetical protein
MTDARSAASTLQRVCVPERKAAHEMTLPALTNAESTAAGAGAPGPPALAEGAAAPTLVAMGLGVGAAPAGALGRAE